MGWEENIRRVVPYTPGEQPKNENVIKLNTNENPYPPAPNVQKILQNFDVDQMRLYPDPEASLLVQAIAETYHVQPEQVFVGVGSDDVLSMAFLTFFHSNKKILFPDVTYSFYDVWAELYHIPYETIPLTETFHINPEDYTIPNGGIIFPNPNAPTGVFENLDTVEKILQNNPDSVVIVDEAYIDFGGISSLSLLEKYENLLVVQTFSKSRSMAGMRIGFAIGSEKLIRYLNDVKFSVNSYTMNQVTLACGAETLKDKAYFETCTNKIIRTREQAKQNLRSLGFVFPDSMSNFIFAKHPEHDAGMIFQKLKEKNIFVRYWNKPRINQYLRITIGTPENMQALFTALEKILQEKE